LLAEQGYHVTWNDLREEVAEYVRLKCESGTIRFAPGNVFDLEFRDTFDLVLATEVIEHIAHPDEFLAQLARMLKPRGYIVLTTPNGAYFRNRLPKFSDCPDPAVFEADQFKPDGDGHIFVLHPEELKILAVKAGLTVKDYRLFANPLTSGLLKTAPVLRMMPKIWIERVEVWTRSWPTALQRRINLQMAVLLQKCDSRELPASDTEPNADIDRRHLAFVAENISETSCT
jgi:2-polyprenyl-6-hydroxyphenyl methylase/3-demethylubiquinone-9 3-methyltransferase